MLISLLYLKIHQFNLVSPCIMWCQPVHCCSYTSNTVAPLPPHQGMLNAATTGTPGQGVFRRTSRHRHSSVTIRQRACAPAGACSGKHTRSCVRRSGKRAVKPAQPQALSSSAQPQAEAEPSQLTSRDALDVLVDEDTSSSSAYVHVTVPQRVLVPLRQEVLNRASQQANIPGFRSSPPEEIVINQMGQNTFAGYLVEYLLKACMPAALSDVADRAFDGTENVETPYDEIAQAFGGAKVEPQSDARFTVSVTVLPEVHWLDDAYKLDGMEVQVPSAGDENHIEAEAQNAIQQQRRNQSQLRIVQDRGLQPGDIAVLDLQAERVEGPEEADPLLEPKQEKFNLDTTATDTNLPGLVEALEDMKPGDEREFELTFPEDWSQSPLRNVHARFHAYLRELFVRSEEHLPDVSEDELRQARIQARRQRDADQEEAEMAAVESRLLDLAHVDLTEKVLYMVGRQMFGERLADLQLAGKIPPGEIEQMVTEDRLEEFMGQNREYVQREAKRQIVVQKYADEMGIDVPEDVMQREVQEARKQLYGQSDSVEGNEEDLRERVRDVQLRARALDHLRERMQVVVLEQQ